MKKIIIVGNGKLGFSLARDLAAEKHDITVIDSNPVMLRSAENRLDVDCIVGNGVSSEVLLQAGVDKANLVLAVTGKDEVNMLICLIAHKLGARHTIARVRDPEYVRNVRLLREDMKLSMVLNPELEAAREIARILRFPSARKIEFLAKGHVEVVTIKLEEDSPLNGVVLDALRAKTDRILICAVQRGTHVSIPKGDFVLRAGDIISITASPQDVTTFFHAHGLTKKPIRTVSVVGGGRTSYYLARELADMDIKLKILEANHERCMFLADEYPKARVIEGDATDKELLQEENITDCDALAALTGLDEENVVVSMYAITQGVGKVLAKVNHIGLSEALDSTGIDSIITPHMLATHQVVRWVRARVNSTGSRVESLTRLVDGRVEALEFKAKDSFPVLNVPLAQLSGRIRRDVIIAAIIRYGRVIYPHGADSIHAEDSVIVVTTATGLDDLSDILLAK